MGLLQDLATTVAEENLKRRGKLQCPRFTGSEESGGNDRVCQTWTAPGRILACRTTGESPGIRQSHHAGRGGHGPLRTSRISRMLSVRRRRRSASNNSVAPQFLGEGGTGSGGGGSRIALHQAGPSLMRQGNRHAAELPRA
jgi:hypothetical protein